MLNSDRYDWIHNYLTKYNINRYEYLNLYVFCFILILTPISTVAIGLAISLTVILWGRFHGCRDYGSILSLEQLYEKSSQVFNSLLLGAMKMMMPQHTVNKYVSRASLIFSYYSCFGSIFNLTGTPQTSGFSLVSLVGPILPYQV